MSRDMVLHIQFPQTHVRLELLGSVAIFDDSAAQCSEMTECTIALTPHGFLLTELSVAIQNATVVCTTEVVEPTIRVFYSGKLAASFRCEDMRLLPEGSITFHGNQ